MNENENTFLCACCGERFPTLVRFEFRNMNYCETCLNEETVLCTRCGERILREDNAGNEDFPLCENCFDDYYHTCSRCGRIIHNDDTYYRDVDDDEPFCYECWSRYHDTHRIHDYNYKPTPIFYGKGPRYFGVELEIDGAGELETKAEDIEEVANGDGTERIYIKHDGSLDDGMELVTHPMSLDYHLHEMPWREVLQKAISLRYLSHSAGTCGLHVHISRDAFGETTRQQDNAIARVLWFFEKHWNELLRFSRRTQRQLDRWASRYGYKDHPQEMMEHVKKGYANRYTCVNLTNEETVEIRMFRGTLKYNTLLATLQMVNRICDTALKMSDEEIRNLSWSEFVSKVTEPELIQYLKERRLYVNEPVSGEGEI